MGEAEGGKEEEFRSAPRRKVSTLLVASPEEGMIACEKIPDPSKPTLISMPGLTSKMSEPLIKSLLTSFGTEFSKSALRSSHGRGGQACPCMPATSLAQATMSDIFGNFEQNIEGPAEFKESLKVANFGVVQDGVKAYAETFGLASLRYHSAGSREVALASWSEFVEYLREHVKADPLRFPPSKASAAFKSMDDNQAKLFKSSGKQLYYGTLSEGHILYVPAGWLVVEKTGPDSDLLGFVLRGLCKDDTNAAPFFQQLTAVLSTASASDNKQKEAAAACLAFLGVPAA